MIICPTVVFLWQSAVVFITGWHFVASDQG